jgi:hypothetical protein
MQKLLVYSLVAGLVHHFAVQYPKQAKLETTLYVYGLLNIACAIVAYKVDQPPSARRFVNSIVWLLPYLCIFDTVYVTTHWESY